MSSDVKLAGRDLDAAVARALGYDVREYIGRLWLVLDPGPENDLVEPLPPYSSDMGACWREVVTELERCGLEPLFDKSELGWHVTVWGPDYPVSHEIDIQTADVPAALCRALLKVKEKGEGA